MRKEIETILFDLISEHGVVNHVFNKVVDNLITYFENSMHTENSRRSCFVCKNRTLCFVFREIMNVTKEIKVNIDGEDATGKWKQIFDSMGNCCLKFEKCIEN
jgi:hypothetical protein